MSRCSRRPVSAEGSRTFEKLGGLATVPVTIANGWLHAVLYLFALPVVFAVVCGALILALPPDSAAIACLAVAVLIVFVLVPLHANALNYQTVREKVRIASRPGWGRDKQLSYVTAAGGTSGIGIAIDVPAAATHELTDDFAGDLELRWLPSACRPGASVSAVSDE